MSESVLRI